MAAITGPELTRLRIGILLDSFIDRGRAAAVSGILNNSEWLPGCPCERAKAFRPINENGITFAVGFRHFLLNPIAAQCSSGRIFGCVPQEVKSFRIKPASDRIRFRHRTF